MNIPQRANAYKPLVRLASASPELVLGDTEANAEAVIKTIIRANEDGADYLTLPELCLVGVTMGTLMRQPIILKAAQRALMHVCDKTKHLNIIASVGLPYEINGCVRSCCAIISGGRVFAIIPSDCSYMPFGFLPELDYCAESENTLTPIPRLCVRFGNEMFYDPASAPRLAPRSAMMLPSAVNSTAASYKITKEMLCAYSARTGAAIMYASPNTGESVTSAVFDSFCAIAANGELLAVSEPFANDAFITADVDLSALVPFEPYIKHGGERDTYLSENEDIARDECERIIELQAYALKRRLSHIGSKGFVIGVSGGLDSTLALIAAIRACDLLNIERSNVAGISMPGLGTSDRTRNNAKLLIEALGASYREIDIKAACIRHFKDIDHPDSVHNVVYENAQARERTQILLDVANKEGLLNVGTGDLSESALGWTTFGGDHLAQFAINASLPKTVIRRVVGVAKTLYPEAADVLQSILDTPVSPELLPLNDSGEIAQKTEEIVGAYELHDLFLFNMLVNGASPRELYDNAIKETEFGEEAVYKTLGVFLNRFFSQQFKRNCAPEGPNILISISPSYITIPSDIKGSVWLQEYENIKRS